MATTGEDPLHASQSGTRARQLVPAPGIVPSCLWTWGLRCRGLPEEGLSPKRGLLVGLGILSSSLPQVSFLCSCMPRAPGRLHLLPSFAERLGKTVWTREALQLPQPSENPSDPQKPHLADKSAFGQKNSIIGSVAWPFSHNHSHKWPFPGGISQTLL